MHTDSNLIDELGGPSKLAELLGFSKSGGAQRVHNWRVRGIPPSVKLQYPNVFLLDGKGRFRPGAAVLQRENRLLREENAALRRVLTGAV